MESICTTVSRVRKIPPSGRKFEIDFFSANCRHKNRTFRRVQTIADAGRLRTLRFQRHLLDYDARSGETTRRQVGFHEHRSLLNCWWKNFSKKSNWDVLFIDPLVNHPSVYFCLRTIYYRKSTSTQCKRRLFTPQVLSLPKHLDPILHTGKLPYAGH